MTDEDDQFRREVVDLLAAQAEEIFDHMKIVSERLEKQNFLANSGGAVATLAFMGSENADRDAVWALGVFVAGIVANWIKQRITYHSMEKIHKDRLKKRQRFLNGEVGFHDLQEIDSGSVWLTTMGNFFGWGSDIAFVVGVVLGSALLLL